jgi:hypothetical protein
LAAGDILLLHDGGPDYSTEREEIVLHVLPRILEEIKGRELKVVPLP